MSRAIGDIVAFVDDSDDGCGAVRIGCVVAVRDDGNGLIVRIPGGAERQGLVSAFDVIPQPEDIARTLMEACAAVAQPGRTSWSCGPISGDWIVLVAFSPARTREVERAVASLSGAGDPVADCLRQRIAQLEANIAALRQVAS